MSGPPAVMRHKHPLKESKIFCKRREFMLPFSRRIRLNFFSLISYVYLTFQAGVCSYRDGRDNGTTGISPFSFAISGIYF